MTPIHVLIQLRYHSPDADQLARMASDCMRVKAYATAWECIEAMLPLDRERAHRAAETWERLVRA